MKPIRNTSRTSELTRKVSLSLCSNLGGADSMSCGGRTFYPDMHNAYVMFEMAHGFLVETVDGRGLHPQVVANSYRSLEGKLFDLAHFIKSYDPSVQRDVVLGTIMAVELVCGGQAIHDPERWTVQRDRATAMGIRAVAVMHKQLDRVPEILATWDSGRIEWKVSMEQDYPMDPETGIAVTSGWALRIDDLRYTISDLPKELQPFCDNTPEDFREIGLLYVPCMAAPAALNGLLDTKTGAVKGTYKGMKATILFGGLNGEVFFKGAGLCPLGAEPEAHVAQMLAAASVTVRAAQALDPKDEDENRNGYVDLRAEAPAKYHDVVAPLRGLFTGK